jgi:uncharacterized protein (TIGR03083 family)
MAGVPSTIPGMIDAFEHTLNATIELAENLSSAEWGLPTECPGWTVQDIVSHLVGVERLLMGEPEPEHELPDGLDYLRHETGRRLEVPVDVRRSKIGPDILAELREIAPERVAQLRALAASGDDPEMVTSLWGPRPLSRLMPTRVFDTWAHEQDIRRAVNRPGNLDSPAAEVTRDFLVRVLPHVVDRAELPAYSSVQFDVSGAQQIHELVGDGVPMVEIKTDWETFVRLTCGRVDPGLAKVDSSGNPGHVYRVLAALAVTP